jgi:DNA primase
VPISQETINEVRDRADIVDVVSRFIDLRRAGVNFKATCPFHDEKTPSFVVSPDKQIFHCFGCGRGGNVFTFLMEMEGVSFPDAVRALGKQYGVEVADDRAPDPKEQINESLYRANEFAAAWYHARLLDPKTGRDAQRYLAKRGIPKSAWVTFQLGYAAESWDLFARAVQEARMAPGPFRQLKLLVARDKSDGYYDYFRERVMFPIATPSGRIAAFGARTLDPKAEPKYLNSIESPVYAKRRTLYGITHARDAIRKKRSALLVEGYTDCISLHVHGFENVVASCGTAITPDHAGVLRRLTREVVLVPDADTAGMDAALVAGSVFLAAGLDVKVVRLEKGADPDAAVRALGTEKFAKNVAGALEYFGYVDYIMTDRQLSPREKETLIQRVVAGLSGTDDRLRYEVLAQELARVLQVSPESLPKRRTRGAETRTEAAKAPRRPGPKPGPRVAVEKMMLRLLLENTPEAADARDKLDADDFSQENCREFYKLLDSAWENHIDIRSAAFQKKAEVVGLEGLAAEISLISIPPGNPGILLKDTVRRVKELQIRDELDGLREKLRDLPEESEEAVAVAEHYARLKRALSEL